MNIARANQIKRNDKLIDTDTKKIVWVHDFMEGREMFLCDEHVCDINGIWRIERDEYPSSNLEPYSDSLYSEQVTKRVQDVRGGWRIEIWTPPFVDTV